jgi:hypothetical protein
MNIGQSVFAPNLAMRSNRFAMRNNLLIHLAAWLMRAIGDDGHSFIAPTTQNTGVAAASGRAGPIEAKRGPGGSGSRWMVRPSGSL